MRALLVVLSLVVLIGCGSGTEEPRLTLYSSVDDYVLEEVVAAFEAETGIGVELVGDTEATKTTGLVQRLISEKGAPRADVWWSSEPFGTMRLAREGVLAEIDPPVEGWPAEHLDPEGMWVALGLRARVFVYAPDRVSPEDIPADLRGLTSERWAGRFGIADPRFGTTRGHVAALAAAWGVEPMAGWLAAMRAGGMRVYDGNATVVRSVALGEIDLGLTDTDDVFAAQAGGLDVALLPLPEAPQGEGEAWTGRGLVLPNTAGIVAGAPEPELARRFIEFLLTGPAERILAESDSRNWPVGSEAPPDLGWRVPGEPSGPGLPAASAIEAEAVRAADAALR